MKTLHYIGNHAQDTLSVRAGWAITRLGQRGTYAQVTHSEAVHAVHPNGTVDIASSSLREGGVRLKRGVRLQPGHWLCIDVPGWQLDRSIELLERTAGAPYDLRGAASSALIVFGQSQDRWFCNEWVGAPWLPDSYIFGPAQFAALCASQPGATVTVVGAAL